MGFKYKLKKNSISFIKRYDLWCVYFLRIFQKKRLNYLRFFYLIFLDNLFLRLRKRRRLLRPIVFGENRRFSFLTLLFFKKFFYFKNLLFQNQKKIYSLKFKGLFVRNEKTRFLKEFNFFKSFFFSKGRFKKFKLFFKKRINFYSGSSTNLYFHFENMLFVFLLRMGFFYSFFGLKEVLKSNIILINDILINDRFYFFLPGDTLKFTGEHKSYMKKKFLKNFKKSVFFLPSNLEISYKYLWFFNLKYNNFKFNSFLDHTKRFPFINYNWINLARKMSNF